MGCKHPGVETDEALGRLKWATCFLYIHILSGSSEHMLATHTWTTLPTYIQVMVVDVKHIIFAI